MIQPLIEQFIAPGIQIYTDQYDIYHRLFDRACTQHGIILSLEHLQEAII